jgi:hypothetical protein
MIVPEIPKGTVMKRGFSTPVVNKSPGRCPKHNRLFSLICNTCQICKVCYICAQETHQLHQLMPNSPEEILANWALEDGNIETFSSFLNKLVEHQNDTNSTFNRLIKDTYRPEFKRFFSKRRDDLSLAIGHLPDEVSDPYASLSAYQ